MSDWAAAASLMAHGPSNRPKFCNFWKSFDSICCVVGAQEYC
jgi:hypothetical protein